MGSWRSCRRLRISAYLFSDLLLAFVCLWRRLQLKQVVIVGPSVHCIIIPRFLRRFPFLGSILLPSWQQVIPLVSEGCEFNPVQVYAPQFSASRPYQADCVISPHLHDYELSVPARLQLLLLLSSGRPLNVDYVAHVCFLPLCPLVKASSLFPESYSLMSEDLLV